MTTATLRAVGDSVAVIIPKQWVGMLGLAAGTKVELHLEGNRLTLEPKNKKRRQRYTLAELLAQCDPDAQAAGELARWDQAPAEGNEPS